MQPRLTIGIPSFNRPERCMRAIQSVLGQSVPTRCLVANQGASDDLKAICKEFGDHPNFKYYESPATKLWENWKFIAEMAIEEGAEFFGWLQDDDLISERHAKRVVRSFDYFPNSLVYISRLAMAYDSMQGCHWTGNFGPKVPMDLLRGTPSEFPGQILLPVAYFDGWGMSPAKAFRVGPAFRDMLNDLPDDCDMFTERLDIAFMGLRGMAIADPNIGGYWIMHGRNQSQLTHSNVKSEATSCWRWLDAKMDEMPQWREVLLGWLQVLGNPMFLETFRRNAIEFREDSPYIAQIINMFDSIMIANGVACAPPQQIIDSEFETASQIDMWNKSKTREEYSDALDPIHFRPPQRMTGPFEPPEIPPTATEWERIAVGANLVDRDFDDSKADYRNSDA